MIFISHKKDDIGIAKGIHKYITEKYDVDCWIDELDPDLKFPSENITDYIVKKLLNCSHLIVTFTNNTKGSMWVPFELGIAYQADLAIGVYLHEPLKYSIPEYLNSFPLMKYTTHIDKYVQKYNLLEKSQQINEIQTRSKEASETGMQKPPNFAKNFIHELKRDLGQ